MNIKVKNLTTKPNLFIVLVLVALSTPRYVHAQDTISELLTSLQDIVNQLLPLVASLALLGFFWGLAKYIFNAGSEEAQEQGKRIMIGGIIALFLIASVGGIIEFLSSALGFDTGETIDPPSIMYNGGDGIG